MRDSFITSNMKFQILIYINTSLSRHYLKRTLCESLLRNIILELYSMYFDHTKDTIPKIIIDKLQSQIKINGGIYTANYHIDVTNITTGDVRKEAINKCTRIELNNVEPKDGYTNLDFEKIKNKLIKYRNKVLSHKDFDYDYNITIKDLEDLVSESRKIITALLCIVEPSTGFCLEVSGVNAKGIRSLFESLAMS